MTKDGADYRPATYAIAPRPTTAEATIVAFSVLYSLLTLLPLEPTRRDPFLVYRENPGVILINSVGLVVSGLLVTVISLGRAMPSTWQRGRLVAMALAVVGAALPWMEVWWGAQFYYGEVRDKQGLPFGTTFGGPIGTTLFVGYLGLRTRLAGPGVRGRLWRAALTLLAVVAAQVALTLATREALRY